MALHDSFEVLRAMLQSLRHGNVQVVVRLLGSQVLHTQTLKCVVKKENKPQSSLTSDIWHIVKITTYNNIKLGVYIHDFACNGAKTMSVGNKVNFVMSKKHSVASAVQFFYLTRVVHHRQSRHSFLHKDVECFDDGRVRVDESNVMVRSNAQLPQGLLHESRLWHFTHLQHTNAGAHTDTERHRDTLSEIAIH